MTDSHNNPIKDFEKLFKKFKSEFDMDGYDIVMKYQPKGSINTADIESIINEIESEGEYEVKLLIHDYLKRIDPAINKNDIRLNLGEVVNDFSILAKHLKIPVITANQMNKEAYKVLENDLEGLANAKNKDKKDLAKNLSLTMQSESSQIHENADGVYGIHREYLKSEDAWFLAFKDLKMRGSKKTRTMENIYFAHPFMKENSMRLVEDIDKPTMASIKNISDLLENFDPNSNIESENNIEKNLESEFEDD